MQRFFRSSKVKFAGLIIAALLSGILFAAFTNSSSSFFTSIVSVVFSPLDKAAAAVSRRANSFSISFRSSSVYLEKIEELEKEINENTQKLADYEKMKMKIKDYETILELKKRNPDFELCYGMVIARDAADAGSSFVLDVGRADGVSINDPVICSDNVVGIIKKVNTTTSVALTVLDTRLNIGAYEVRTGEKGIAVGSAKLQKDGLLKLSGLKGTTAVVSGGIVSTSGAGGIFPAGLIIGTVTTVEDDVADTSSYATVKPACNISELTGVFVITNFPGQGEKNVSLIE
ncbi:MAG TPA: rod shape-determining protein MreC [Clostridia bacterium]|nr:rod shape-determining protein MreC [Clostridia bacterium]